MDKNLVNQWLDVLDSALAEAANASMEARKELNSGSEPDEGIEVESDLQGALDTGGNIYLKTETQFSNGAGFTFKVNGTQVHGRENNTLTSVTGNAVTFPKRYSEGLLENVYLYTEESEVVCLIGKNDSSQVTLEDVPNTIALRNVTVNGHEGKRAVEINGQDITIEDCHFFGVFSPEGQDSQAICVLNSPGNIHIRGGILEAASECFMVGGDEMKLVNTRPTNILIEDVEFTKRVEWKSAGTPKVKNILELKDGHNVTIRNCKLHKCWKSAQDGYAFMFTPTRGGSLQGVRVENCEVFDVGGILNTTGIDRNWETSTPRTQIEFIGGSFRTNRAEYPGPSNYAILVQWGPEWVRFNDCYMRHEANSFMEVTKEAPIDQLHIINCDWNYGQYGIRFGGYSHGDNQLGIVKDLRIEGNTITGAHSQFKTRYPNNIYV